MKLTTDAFLKSLTNHSLQSIYWLAGDESLPLEDCKLALMKKAAATGFLETQRLDGKSLDEQDLKAALYTQSLFSDARIIEIRLTLGKLEAELAEILLQFLLKPNPAVLVILISPKFEAGVTASKFYKTLETSGTIVQSWPISLEHLPKWLSQRLANHGLSTTLDGLKAFAELAEGNLLYAAQGIEKLKLHYPGQNTLTTEQILAVLAPQAVFDTFQLNDAFLSGDKIRSLKICRMLKTSGAEIILTHGALLKDLRTIYKLQQMGGEKQFAQNCQKLGVWEKKRPLFRKAMQQKTEIQRMFEALAIIDQQMKNNKFGNPWLSLERFMIEYG